MSLFDEEPGPTQTAPEPDEDAGGDPQQISFFEDDEHAHWKELWENMPEFVQKDLEPAQSIVVHFETLADLSAFAALVDQKLTPNTRSIWYPELEIGHFADKRYIHEDNLNGNNHVDYDDEP